MIEGLVPYPEYRDSGLPWLPKIPASWSVARNGRLFTQRNKTGHSDLPILEVSLRSGVRVRDMKDGDKSQVTVTLPLYPKEAKDYTSVVKPGENKTANADGSGQPTRRPGGRPR